MTLTNRIILIISITLAISLSLNVVLFIGKGININPVYQTHNHMHQEQMQGQLLISGFSDSFYKKDITMKMKKFDSMKKVLNFLKPLHPVEQYFVKIIPFDTDEICIVYPSLMTKKEKK